MSKGNNTTIIERFPDQPISEPYLRKILSEHPSCGGYAVQGKTPTGAPVIISDRMDIGVELEAVQQLLKGYPSNRILFTFSKLDKVTETVMQPFDLTIEGKPEDVLMAFALDGDFVNVKGEEETTQAAMLSKTFLIPVMRKFIQFSGGDLSKFLAELKDPTFVDSILARVGERGEYCFLPPVGDAIWWGKNKLGSTFPWGRVSNTFGYTEDATAKTEKTETKADKRKGWWNTGPDLPVASEEPETKPMIPNEPPPVPLDIPADKPDTKIDAPPATPTPSDQPKEDLSKVPPPTGHWEVVPNNMSKKDRKSYIRRMTNCGSVLPEGYDRPDFKVWVVDYPKPARDLRELADKMQVPGPIGQQQQPKDMRDPNGPRPAPAKGSETTAAEASAMILSVDEKSRAESSILKIMDRQGKTIPSPLEIQKAVAKYPRFTKTMGVDLARVRQWLPEDLIAFSKENGKAFCHLMFEAFSKISELETQLATTNTGTAPKAEEPATVSQPEPEPKKTGTGWSSGWG